MADPVINLGALRALVAGLRIAPKPLPRVALQAMHDTLTDALLHDVDSTGRRVEQFDAGKLLADYLQRLEAAGLK